MIEIEPWQPGQDLGEWADRLCEAVAELRQYCAYHRMNPVYGSQGTAWISPPSPCLSRGSGCLIFAHRSFTSNSLNAGLSAL